MNIYRFRFWATCPNDGQVIEYSAEVRTAGMTMVEDLRAFGAATTEGFHEAIADAMRDKFGGFQRLTAVHQGVEIETIRWATQATTSSTA